MGGVTFDAEWSYRGLQVLRLENDLLQVDILPTLGAKIWRLLHKPSAQQPLWHHPRIPPRVVSIGANYDDNFCGGWDELFPNDAPGEFGGESYPDHGELWCQPWTWEVSERTAQAVSVRLARPGACTASLVEKTVTLRAGEAKLRFEHRLHNLGHAPLDFLWKLHPALRIGRAHVLDVPAERAVVVNPAWSRCTPALQEFPWPVAKLPDGQEIDFRRIPEPGAGSRDFLYLVGLRAGWCALTDTETGVGIGFAFPQSVFTSVWVFLTNGGWRGLDCLVLEPCTAWPKDLNQARARGQIAHLEPGKSLSAAVVATTYVSHTGVAEITPDGEVTNR